MNTLIKITDQTFNGQLVKTVNARELHEFLESKKQFTDWVKLRIEQYNFIENQDFISFSPKSDKPSGGRPSIEYFISLDMAKELSMVERNAKGKQARQYFIECERIAKEASAPTLPTNYLDALKALVVSEETKAQLLLESAAKDAVIEQQKPAVEFLAKYVDSEGLVGIRCTGKILGIPQNDFVQLMITNKVLYRLGKTLVPFTYHEKKGRLVLKTNTFNEHVTKRTFFTADGVAYVANLLGKKVQI